MKKLLIPLIAAAALAVPATALAHHGPDGAIAGFEKLSGTGTSFGGASATATGSLVASVDHPNGHFSATLSTTWSSAQTKTFSGKHEDDGDDDDNGTTTTTTTPVPTFGFSCAPATASVTLSNGTTSTTSYTGKTCSFTRNGTTAYGFTGVASDGTRVFLKESGTTVVGAVFAGLEGMHMGAFGFGFKHGDGHHH